MRNRGAIWLRVPRTILMMFAFRLQ